MEEIITTKAEEKIILQKVIKFLKIKNVKLTTNIVEECIKEICVAKLCSVIGIKCKYNYKSEFFNFFSSIVGEAVCRKLNISLKLAEDKYRLFKYEHINLIEHTISIFDMYDIEEAFIEIFEFLDKFKYVIKLK